jgi:hypothetical protein
MRVEKRLLDLRFFSSCAIHFIFIIALAPLAGVACGQQLVGNPNPVAPVKITDLVTLKISQGNLVMESDYKKNQQEVQEMIAVEGHPTGAELIISRDTNGKLIQFGLTMEGTARGRQGTEILSLTPSAIEVFGDYQDDSVPPVQHTIELFQNFGGAEPLVSVVRIDPDKMAYPLMQGHTFAEMVDKNTRLVSRFLRPIILDDFKMQEVLGPPSLLAKVVFADESPVAPAVAANVSKLVDQLNADAYTDREAADKELRDAGADAVISLLKMDRTPLSPEQNARIDAILRRENIPSSQEIEQYRHDAHFLLNCQLCSNPDVRAAALKVLIQLEGHHLPISATGNYSQRAQGIEAVRSQLESSATKP